MRRLLIATAALAGVFSPLRAQDEYPSARITYSTSWSAAKPLFETDHPLPIVGAEASIERGDFVLAARLFPDQVASLDASILDEKGKTLAVEGQQLFSLSTSAGRIFCAFNSAKVSAISKLLIGGAESKHNCFVDADEDGAFESYFKAASIIKALPNFDGRTRKKPQSIALTTYAIAPGEEMSEFLFVGLEYRGNANPRKNHVFETVFGNSEKRDSLSNRLVVESKDLPKELNFLGGRFELISGQESVAFVRVDMPMQPTPFGVAQTVEIRTY